jgi:hypothetical protein
MTEKVPKQSKPAAPQKPKKFSYGAHVKKHAPRHPKAMHILR